MSAPNWPVPPHRPSSPPTRATAWHAMVGYSVSVLGGPRPSTRADPHVSDETTIVVSSNPVEPGFGATGATHARTSAESRISGRRSGSCPDEPHLSTAQTTPRPPRSRRMPDPLFQ